MTPRSKLSAALLLGLSAVAATGFAYKSNDISQSQVAPAYTTPTVMSTDQAQTIAPAATDTPIAPAATDETAAPAPRPARADLEHYSLPRVEVTAPRPSDDELLRNAVLDRLASDSRLSGRIGVEAYRHTVSLTGRVMSTMQVDRAEMITKGVDGVWDVNNYLRARVGES